MKTMKLHEPEDLLDRRNFWQVEEEILAEDVKSFMMVYQDGMPYSGFYASDPKVARKWVHMSVYMPSMKALKGSTVKVYWLLPKFRWAKPPYWTDPLAPWDYAVAWAEKHGVELDRDRFE